MHERDDIRVRIVLIWQVRPAPFVVYAPMGAHRCVFFTFSGVSDELTDELRHTHKGPRELEHQLLCHHPLPR